MRLTATHGVFGLVMSPREWREVHALAKFAPADGRNSGDVTLALPEEEMRRLLIALNLSADAEKQADLLYHAAHEEFPYRFPDIEVAARHYSQAFEDLLTALHENRSLVINLTAAGSPAPKLDKQNIPLETRIYLEGRMRDLVTQNPALGRPNAQNPETYAADPREIESQTDELIEKINSMSSRRHKEEMPPPDSESSTSFRPKDPFDYSELKASVEKRGGSISAELNAEQLRSQLSDDQWSKITSIDPEVIKAEERKQQQPYVPNLRRYNIESGLAQTLLEDEKIRVHLA